MRENSGLSLREQDEKMKKSLEEKAQREKQEGENAATKTEIKDEEMTTIKPENVIMQEAEADLGNRSKKLTFADISTEV